MALFPTHKISRTLDARQKALLQQKRINGSYTADFWLSLLNLVGEYDRAIETTRKQAMTLIVISLVLAIVSGIGITVTETFIWQIPLTFVVIMIAAIITHRGASRSDINDHLRHFVIPFLLVAKEDCKADKPINLQLDLRGSTEKSKFLKKLPNYSAGRYHKIVEKHYLDPWFKANLMLADGTRVNVNISDFTKEQDKTKKSISGKSKTKTKHKVTSTIDLTMGFRKKLYTIDDSKAKLLQGKSAIKQGEKWVNVRLRNKVKSNTDEELLPKELFNLMAKAYMWATPLNSKV